MTLTVVVPAPAMAEGDGWWLDTKFLAGMEHYAREWPGETTAVLAEVFDQAPFMAFRRTAELPFRVATYTPGQRVSVKSIPPGGLVLCGGDEAEFVHLAAACAARGQPLVFAVEYTLETRIRIAWLDRGRGVLRKLRTTQWSMALERRRRAAFRKAAGLQFNGYPAHDALGHLNARTMLYFDNRVTEGLLVTEEEQAQRSARIRGGGRLTLVHSGRLETLKGAQDLVPLAGMLVERGIDFELHIFGPGSLTDEMSAQIGHLGLSERVILHGPVDFADDLMPFFRANADLFLSCHRQSDPSCTYLETLGCGAPVLGYGNRMWSRMQEASGAGWTVPMGRTRQMADFVASLDRDRGRMAEASVAARDFAAAHLFDAEFSRRIAHMREIAEI